MIFSTGKILQVARRFLPDQRGITGLETAIVLIAFVVVSSVFAFAVLSTGLFSSDKARETIAAGLAEARGTLELKGSVILKNTSTDEATMGTSGTATSIVFQVSNAAAGEAIDMTPGNTIIKYSDQDQTVNMISTSTFTATKVGAFGDTDSLLEMGEIFEVILLDMTAQLDPDLGTNKNFTIEVIPPRGAVLFIGRRSPVSMEKSNNLD